LLSIAVDTDYVTDAEYDAPDISECLRRRRGHDDYGYEHRAQRASRS